MTSKKKRQAQCPKIVRGRETQREREREESIKTQPVSDRCAIVVRFSVRFDSGTGKHRARSGLKEIERAREREGERLAIV